MSTPAKSIISAFRVGRLAYQQGKSVFSCAYKDSDRTVAFEAGWRYEQKKKRKGR